MSQIACPKTRSMEISTANCSEPGRTALSIFFRVIFYTGKILSASFNSLFSSLFGISLWLPCTRAKEILISPKAGPWAPLCHALFLLHSNESWQDAALSLWKEVTGFVLHSGYNTACCEFEIYQGMLWRQYSSHMAFTSNEKMPLGKIIAKICIRNKSGCISCFVHSYY